MIKRYNHELDRFCNDGQVEEQESDTGKWVKYEDHLAEINKLEQIIKVMDSDIISLQKSIMEWY
jgi:exonuclease VII small subunit